MRVAPMFASLEVCQTSRNALADQLEMTYFGIRHSFPRSLVDQHPCWTVACFLPCTRPPDIAYQRFANYLICAKDIRCDDAAELEILTVFKCGVASTKSCSTPSLCTIIPCQGTSRTLPHVLGGPHHLCSRPSRHLLRRAAHPEGISSFCFFRYFSRSYSLYSGEHFLFYVFVISVFSVFTYIHCVHTRSRSALLVYLGERTGSLLGLISLSISDFSIGSVQSHHIYVFCTSSLALNLEGHIYI